MVAANSCSLSIGSAHKYEKLFLQEQIVIFFSGMHKQLAK